MVMHIPILQLGSQNAAWKYIFLKAIFKRNTRGDKIPQMQTSVLTKKVNSSQQMKGDNLSGAQRTPPEAANA